MRTVDGQAITDHDCAEVARFGDFLRRTSQAERAGVPHAEAAAAIYPDVYEVCKRCDEVKRERRAYNATTRETTVTLYCYGCENADLTRLARSVGK